MQSFGVNKDCVDFLLFLELAICFADSNMLILPIFSADWVSAGLNNDTLESLDPLTHLLV